MVGPGSGPTPANLKPESAGSNPGPAAAALPSAREGIMAFEVTDSDAVFEVAYTGLMMSDSHPGGGKRGPFRETKIV